MSIRIPFPQMSKELEHAFNQVFKTVDEKAQNDPHLTGKTNFQMNVVMEQHQLGISIKRLHNLVFASPCKSNIRIQQSIGRMVTST